MHQQSGQRVVALITRVAGCKNNMKEINLSIIKAQSSVKVFESDMFGTLRIIITDDQKTLFNLNDVCRALEINNPRQVKARLERRGVITADTPTQNQYGATVMQLMTYINEGNLYRCIFQSRKAEAEKFQTWVFEEVLPQIRKTGGYIPIRNAKTGEQLSDNEVLMVAEQIMQRTISQKNLPADNCLTTSEIAKSLGMPTKEVNRVLVSEGILFWNGGRYKIRKEYADCNYVRERRFHYFALDGEKKERSYLVWTKKGRDFVNAVVEFKNLSTTWKQKS